MALADILELVKDKPELVKEITETYGLADASGKIKTANAELTGQRDTWKSEKADLEKQIKDAKEAGGKNSDPEIRALNERLEALGTEVQSWKSKAEQAEAKKAETELRNDFVSAATRADAPNKAARVDELFVIMKHAGLVGHDADGKAFFHKLNAAGEHVACKPSEAVDAYLKLNAHHAAPSGTQGSGKKPNSAGSGGNDFNPDDHLKDL